MPSESSFSRPAFIHPHRMPPKHYPDSKPRRSNKLASKKNKKPTFYDQQPPLQPLPSAWDMPSDPWQAQGPSAEAWFSPAAEDASLVTREHLRGKEHQYFADQVEDMVPFWIRGIEAAERGEVLRLEEFLNSLEAETWPPRGHDIWAHGDRYSSYGGRNAWEPAYNNDIKKWGGDSLSCLSAESGRRTGKTYSEATHGVASYPHPNSLVEVLARQNAADENKKREMYSFFELPTSEKVKKIDDLIRTLRSS